MRTNKSYLFALIPCMVFPSCIDRFYINSEENLQNKIVIDGLFTNEGIAQEVIISEPGMVESTRFIPKRGCIVTVEDDQKQVISFAESDTPGHYQATPSSQFARIGSSYRLTVKTPNGKQYCSNFEEMLPCPKVDSVYFERKMIETSTIGDNEDGLQFYINFRGDNSLGRQFRWNLKETYEYHSTWSISRYVDEDNKIKIIPEDFSNYVCYKTEPIYEIYTLSTNGLAQNIYSKYPLHFVNNETQRLMFHYSLLVKQYSLTESAYNFWENLRKNNKQSEFIFGKQAAQIKSNIYNVNDSTETVLGYFGVSAVNTKRIHIRFVPGLTFNKVKHCAELIKPDPPKERPLYLFPYYNDDGSILWTWNDRECFLCTLWGGTTERPLYWDDK